MEQGKGLPCQGQPIKNPELTPWCQDCPLRSVGGQAINAKAAKLSGMASEAAVSREVEDVACQGKNPMSLESTCGVAVGNVCDNPFLRMLVAEWQASQYESVQSDAHLLE